MNKLSGKVAIVRRATSGIGLATAKLYLQEGATVVLTGQSSEKLNVMEEELSGDHLLVKPEASNTADSKALVNAIAPGPIETPIYGSTMSLRKILT